MRLGLISVENVNAEKHIDYYMSTFYKKLGVGTGKSLTLFNQVQIH